MPSALQEKSTHCSKTHTAVCCVSQQPEHHADLSQNTNHPSAPILPHQPSQCPVPAHQPSQRLHPKHTNHPSALPRRTNPDPTARSSLRGTTHEGTTRTQPDPERDRPAPNGALRVRGTALPPGCPAQGDSRIAPLLTREQRSRRPPMAAPGALGGAGACAHSVRPSVRPSVPASRSAPRCGQLLPPSGAGLRNAPAAPRAGTAQEPVGSG